METGLHHANRRESQDNKLNEWPAGHVLIDFALSTRNSRPLPPPEPFVRRQNIKPPAGPSTHPYFETAKSAYISTNLDDPYDGILEALMQPLDTRIPSILD
jgi:hypothetical protein